MIFFHRIVGIYDKTDELAGGQPIYSRRGLTENGKQLIMEYYELLKTWHIEQLENKGTMYTCYAYLACDPPVLPHLIEGVWTVADRDAPGAEVKFIAQPAVKVSRVPAPPSADVLLFWEMVGTIFQYVGLMRGPIHTMEDLVEVLSKRRDLCVEEEMKKVVSKKDLLLLQRKLHDHLHTLYDHPELSPTHTHSPPLAIPLLLLSLSSLSFLLLTLSLSRDRKL